MTINERKLKDWATKLVCVAVVMWCVTAGLCALLMPFAFLWLCGKVLFQVAS
jgi:hypothetical protein